MKIKNSWTKKKKNVLFSLCAVLLFIFLPAMVPGAYLQDVDEYGCFLIDYDGTASFPVKFIGMDDSRERRQLLIDTLLPLVLKANEDILCHRQKLLKAKASPQPLSLSQVRLIEDLARAYRVEPSDHRAMLDELLLRVDALPPSLMLAQAVIESGWGTSRFALEGNNVYGLRGPRGAGMVPRGMRPGSAFSVSTFENLQACGDSYLWNINTRTEYERLRKIRARRAFSPDPLELASGLDAYSERGDAYVGKVVELICGNNLKEYDIYRLRPAHIPKTALVQPRPSGLAGT